MNGTIIENGKQRRIRDCFAKYNNPDYLGKKYNRLTVIGFEHRGAHWWWKCECDCGNIKVVYPRKVLNGHTSSCGCIRKERVRSFTELYRTKHGDSGTRLHYIWSGMRSRCENPNNKDYHNYGERGIKVCEEWGEYANFKEWAANNGYMDNLTIERVDVNGNYCPENCTWIPLPKQARNRRTTRWVEYQGKTMSLAEAAERANQRYGLVALRLSKGWSLEKALNTPVQDNKSELHKECDSVGADYNVVCARIKSGWSKEDAISIPKQKHGTSAVNPNASFATCAVCGKEFKKRTARMKYCSSDCARIAKNRKCAISKQQAATI